MNGSLLNQRYRAIEQKVRARLFISIGLLLALIAPPLFSLLIQLNDQMRFVSLDRHRARAERLVNLIQSEKLDEPALKARLSELFRDSLLSDNGRLILMRDGSTIAVFEPKATASSVPFLGGKYELAPEQTLGFPGSLLYERQIDLSGRQYRLVFLAHSIPYSAIDRLTRLDLLNFGFCLLFGLALIYWSHRSSLNLARAQSDLALSIAHEIRTPLASMRLYSELLSDGISQNPAQTAHYREALLKGTERLTNIVERLLNPEQTPARVELTLESIYQSLSKELQTFSQERGLPLAILDAPTPGYLSCCDIDALTQIALIFADNAFKHGKVTPEHPLLFGYRIQRTPFRHRVVLYLANQGSKSRPLATRGAGLGLKIARALARQSGATIRLKKTSVGYQAQLLLPLRSTKQLAADPSTSRDLVNSPLSV